MTAKEKSEELFKKYYCLENNSKTRTKVIEFKTAKQCAIICVDELIRATVPLASTYYWQEVKQKLEKL